LTKVVFEHQGSISQNKICCWLKMIKALLMNGKRYENSANFGKQYTVQTHLMPKPNNT